MENQQDKSSFETIPDRPILFTEQHTKRNLSLQLTLVILFSAIIFGTGGYYLGQQSVNSSIRISNPPAAHSSQAPLAPSSVIRQENTFNDQYFTFEYPKSWTADSSTIYELRIGCKENALRCDEEKNIVYPRSNVTKMYSDYTNSEWFTKISSLATPWITGRDVFTKLREGTTKEGRKYILFKQEPSQNFQGDPIKFLNGYVMDGENLYELRLSRFESESAGVELLQTLVESVRVK